MFKRKKRAERIAKEAKETKRVLFKKKNGGRKPKNLPTESIPEYLPILTSSITDITPDELMFAYSWAKYPDDPKRALEESGLFKGTGLGVRKKQKELLEQLIGSTPVQKAFREALVNKIQALKATNDKSKKYMSCIAYLDKGDAFGEDGKLLRLKDMPFHVRICVQEYEEKEIFPVKGAPYITRKVKFSDNKDALKTLMSETAQASTEMGKMLGNKNTFIQNIHNTTNTNNIIGSGNNYSTLIQNQLDLSKLDALEMDILFKALGIDADVNALEAAKLVQPIIDDIQQEDEEDKDNIGTVGDIGETKGGNNVSN